MPCKKAFSGKVRSLVPALSTATRGRLVETYCARAASGHVAAAPPSSVMNLRRVNRMKRIFARASQTKLSILNWQASVSSYESDFP